MRFTTAIALFLFLFSFSSFGQEAQISGSWLVVFNFDFIDPPPQTPPQRLRSSFELELEIDDFILTNTISFDTATLELIRNVLKMEADMGLFLVNSVLTLTEAGFVEQILTLTLNLIELELTSISTFDPEGFASERLMATAGEEEELQTVFILDFTRPNVGLPPTFSGAEIQVVGAVNAALAFEGSAAFNETFTFQAGKLLISVLVSGIAIESETTFTDLEFSKGVLSFEVGVSGIGEFTIANEITFEKVNGTMVTKDVVTLDLLLEWAEFISITTFEGTSNLIFSSQVFKVITEIGGFTVEGVTTFERVGAYILFAEQLIKLSREIDLVSFISATTFTEVGFVKQVFDLEIEIEGIRFRSLTTLEIELTTQQFEFEFSF